MSRLTLWVQHGPVDAPWQLGDFAAEDAEHVALLGWDEVPPGIDGGVPPPVSAVWSRALCADARVTFLSPASSTATTAWSVAGEDHVRGAPESPIRRLLSHVRGLAGHAMIVCTRRPESVQASFDEPVFPWWLQSQVLLLSASDGPPPDVTTEAVAALLDDDWCARSRRLGSAGVVAVARPAVDGDAMGVLFLDDPFRGHLITALLANADRNGLAWEERY